MTIKKLHKGEVVRIGRILAKQCHGCGVTWALEAYTRSERSQAGVQGVCEQCRTHGRRLA